MNGYFKKVKEAFKMETPTVLGTTITDITGVLSTVRTLQSDVAALKSWKERDAAPSITKNVSSISDNISKIEALVTNIQTMHDEIQDAHKKITALPTQIENYLNIDVVPQLVLQMKKELKLFVDRNVMPPLITFRNSLESVGNGIETDINVIATQGENMTNTINREIGNIQNKFNIFGSQIKSKANNLSEGARVIGRELTEAVDEITPALKAAIAQAQGAAADAKRGRALKAVIHAWKAIAYLVFKGKDGHSAVLPEMAEGFKEISTAFIGLKNNFASFGTAINNESINIGNQMNTSAINIGSSTNNFLIRVKLLFSNMANRIKGGTGRTIVAIENEQKESAVIITDKPAPAPAPYVPTEEKLRQLEKLNYY